MAIKHGNKTYMQILLDPNRAQLLMNLAKAMDVRPTGWIRDVIYKELERCVPSDSYQKALDADKKVWENSVKRRVEGRTRLKKDSKDE
ncbi:hypothetical protein [Limnobacter sp.]|uniref:hypothetical protein n=1 Tax=Limnobacter sp. TaxID=2003368 RepID=UPI0025BB6D2A|nr:hypothetical protein [Limnobacter sp.]